MNIEWPGYRKAIIAGVCLVTELTYSTLIVYAQGAMVFGFSAASRRYCAVASRFTSTEKEKEFYTCLVSIRYTGRYTHIGMSSSYARPLRTYACGNSIQ